MDGARAREKSEAVGGGDEKVVGGGGGVLEH
jgi:hypothetical protein